MYQDVRPTLPPVRDLFRGKPGFFAWRVNLTLFLHVDELSRSPRPPMSLTPPWIVPGYRADQNTDRSFSRAERRPDSQLDGPGVQHSSSYYSPPTQQCYDGRTASRSQPDNLSSSMSQHHSRPPRQYHARSTSQADQPPVSHDHCTRPGSHSYSNLATQAYNHAYTSSGISSRNPGSMSALVAPELARQPSVPSPSSLKYECDYCGKGFTRPSSLKIHLNSHTGEKPFVCTFEGCGRSFSVLSNMRRHARVHAEAPSRHQESSSDEHSDRQ